MGQHDIRSYRDLLAWRQGRALVKEIYQAARRFPKEELYALTAQLKRAAISVPSNIAEGYGRGSLKDYLRFLQTARGSLYEVQTQLLLGKDLGYLTESQVVALFDRTDECARLLHGLIASLKSKASDG